MKVLLVDDQISILSGLISGIHWEELGIDSICIAENVEKAKNILSQEKVDILLSDIEMPGENGLSLLRWARSNGFEGVCVFLTSHADFIYAKEAMQLNCFDYILQPASYSDIQETLRRAIQRVHVLAEKRHLEELGAEFSQNKEALLRELLDKQAQGQATAMEMTQKQPPRGELIDQIEAYIQAHLEDPLHISDISDVFYLNADYLSRVYRSATGVSLKDYILEQKMKNAQTLLRTTHLPISVIASKLGYDNFSYFSQVYRKIVGVSPSDERK